MIKSWHTTESQEKYNKQVIKQTQKKKRQENKFKVGDMVSIKIDWVEKTSPRHSNLLLSKIEETVNTYACIVTKFARRNTRNIELDYSTELSFSTACKKAM